MKKLLFCLLTLIPFIGFGQCDVDLLGYDPITHQVSIAIINGENCRCNEATQIDGNTCNPNGSSSCRMEYKRKRQVENRQASREKGKTE